MSSFLVGVQLGIGKLFIFATNIRYNAFQIDPCTRFFFPIDIIYCAYIVYYAWYKPVVELSL